MLGRLDDFVIVSSDDRASCDDPSHNNSDNNSDNSINSGDHQPSSHHFANADCGMGKSLGAE